MTERTVRNWMSASEKPTPKLGRPGYSTKERYHALRAVCRQRRLQGHGAGWRVIVAALPDLPTALVQETLRRFKARSRRRKREKIAPSRVRMAVNARDAIWVQDGTHLGRINGTAVESQVIRDRGPMQNIGLMVGSAASGNDVKGLMKMVTTTTGRKPLVWQVDNGSAYVDAKMQKYLEKEQIVSLFSRAGTPTDNGAAEIAMRELKDISGLGKGVKLCSVPETAVLAGKSAVLLNEHRLRGTKGYRSANTLAREMAPWYTHVSRAVFYKEATKMMKTAVQGKNGREARTAEREAVFMVLEKHGLITMTRGGRPHNARSLERIS